MKSLLKLGFVFLGGLTQLAQANVFGDEPPIRKQFAEPMKSADACLRFVEQVAKWEGYQRPIRQDEAEDVGIKDKTGDWIGNSIYQNGVCIIHIWTRHLQ